MKEKKQVDCFHSPIDKKLSIYSELLLRIIICDTFKIRNNNIVLEKKRNTVSHI